MAELDHSRKRIPEEMMSKNPVLVFALFALLAVGQPSWGQLLRRPQSGVPVQKQQQEPAEATVALALNQPGGQATVETPEVGMATGSKPEQDEPIMASRPIPKRRPTKRPQGYEMDDSDECFDDQDEDQSADYSGMVRFAEEPMRHIGRMMGDIMQRMPMFNYQGEYQTSDRTSSKQIPS